MTANTLPIDTLAADHRGITSAVGDVMHEAACVCLHRHHRSPVEFEIQHPPRAEQVQVKWTDPDQRVRDAWANAVQATEWGATGVVIAALRLIAGLAVITRADTGSGADYYAAPVGATPEDLEDCLRLEISGISMGTAAEVHKRLRVKVKQLRDGRGTFPAVAGVVCFECRAIQFESVHSR